MVNFLAEISQTIPSGLHFTPYKTMVFVNGTFCGIYFVDLTVIKKNTKNFWTDWGGTMDNCQLPNLELHFGQYLRKMDTTADMEKTPFSMYIQKTDDKRICYINIPMHPFLYPEYQTETRNVTPYLYAPLSAINPLDNVINNSRAVVRLSQPSINQKISESFAGQTLNLDYSFSLINNDGKYDDDGELEGYFNSPVYIKKSTKDNPEYEDFKNIFDGYIEGVNTDTDSLNISVADSFRSMEEPVCKVFGDTYFYDTVEGDTVGKNIPVIYGRVSTKPVLLNEDTEKGIKTYCIAEYISAVHKIIDNDGNRISHTSTKEDLENGILRISSEFKPETVECTGYTNNRIGEIVKDIVTNKSGILWNDTNWDTKEVESYTASYSPKINIVFAGGTCKAAVGNVLQNDMSYFFQNTDGKLTLRQWGKNYSSYKIDSRFLTKNPSKDFSNSAENYFSSCIVEYFGGKSFHHTGSEMESIKTYKKKLIRTFTTVLENEQAAKKFAESLSKRFSKLKQRISIAVGTDTRHINLLDKIEMIVNINGRQFSDNKYWIVVAHDLANDTMTIEQL